MWFPEVYARAAMDSADCAAAWSSWMRMPAKSCPRCDSINLRTGESSGRPGPRPWRRLSGASAGALAFEDLRRMPFVPSISSSHAAHLLMPLEQEHFLCTVRADPAVLERSGCRDDAFEESPDT